MTLSGGGNTLELQAGYAFTGNVVSSSGTTNGGDTLALGGSADTSFNLLLIGTQYQGFNNFQKTGSSTWVVTGNTAKSWHITGGTLQIGDGVIPGVIAGDITNEASLIFNPRNTVTYSGALSGTGDLTKQGGGTLVLSGTNTYGGNTTVSAGTLRAGVANAFGTDSATSVASGATLDLNGFNQTLGSLAGSGDVTLGSAMLTVGTSNTSTTFSGTINGSGGLTKQGSGTLALSGANTYIGNTNVSNGTLQAGVANAFGTDSATSVASGATLDLNGFNQTLGSLAGSGDVTLGSAILTVGTSNASTTFSGTINGSGGLTKQGSGTLSVTSANTYTGDTTVSVGTLQFSSYSQSGSQTLGIGARSNVDYGKLAVTGIATFAADARIAVDVASVNTLGLGQQLSDVISAGTLNASTFGVTDNSSLFNFLAVRNGNTVDLLILSANGGVYDAVVANGVDSATGGARVLDNALLGGSVKMSEIVTALGKLGTQREVSQAAAQTLPLLSGGVSQTTLGMLSSFNSVVQGRLGSLTGTQGTSGLSGGDGLDTFANRQAWAKAFGSLANQHDADGTSGFSSESWGMAFGADGELDRDTRIGIAYAYANSSVSGNTALSGTRQHANVDSHLLALYGSRALKDDLQLDWQADIGRNGIDGSRQISFGGLNRTAESSHASYSAHVGAGLSKQFALNATTTVAPGVRADYTWLRDDSYRESGAGSLNLDVDSNTTEAFLLTAEGRIRHALSERSQLDANLGIGYDLINDRNSIVSTYAGAPGQSFATRGIDQSPWIVSGGIGYTVQANRNTQITLRYDAEGRDDYLNQTASVKANWAF
ncbi:MAG TPA: autotransporter domain-containing protein [Oxalicibacterium sp.]|nr:autotransporter domain-containing protein [Oxalicibacterium sp.]